MLSDIINSVSRAVAFPEVEPSDLSARPWGDGLIELSLPTLWHPRSWSDVSSDELVLFIPNLKSSGEFQSSPAARIRSAVLGRIRVSLMILGGEPHQTLQNLVLDGELQNLFDDCELQTAIRLDATREELHMAARLKLNASPENSDETFVLASLGRAIRMDADVPPSLDDALIAAIHTAYNTAYICPAHAYAHELLGTGAWLGLILRGRSALMPEFIALVLRDYLSPSRSDSPFARTLRCHVASPGGVACLLQTAEGVLRTGRPAVVHPAPLPAAIRIPVNVP